MQIGGRPLARVGKKQVIAFLRPNQAAAAHRLAATTGKTNQDVLFDAMNAVFAYYQLPTMTPSAPRRVARSQQSTAAIRTSSNSPSCRTGRQAYAGWFLIEDVDRFCTLCKEHQLSVQSVVEFGIKLITDVAPDEGLAWLATAGEEDEAAIA